MARNWASFLNEASRGYGLGFDRYQQYDQAREGREQRALVRGISDDLQTANTPVTTKREAVPMGTPGPGRSVDEARQELERRAAVPTGPGMAQPAPQARAVEPQAPAPAAPTGPQVPIPQGPQDELFAQRLQAADKAEGRVSIPGGAQDRLFAEQLAAADAEAERALPVPPSPTDRKAVAKHQTETAVDILQEIAPLGVRKIMKGGEKIKVEGGRSRMDAFDAAKNKMRDLLARQGDVEGLLSLDAKFEAMQHDRMMGGLRKAMHLMAVDPQAAAEELAKAYSYLPDGTEMDIKVAPDGTLVGRGYDDVTGEFKETMQIDSEMLSQLYRYYEDPAQFHRDMADLRVTNEQLAYDRGRDTMEDWFKRRKLAIDEADLLIKGVDAESKAALRDSQMVTQGALAEKIGMDALQTFMELTQVGGAAPLWKNTDWRSTESSMIDWFKKARTGEIPLSDAAAFAFSSDSPLNPASVTEAATSMMWYAGPGGGLTLPEASHLAGHMALMEMVEGERSTGNSKKDREMAQLYEQSAAELNLEIVGYDDQRGAMVISQDGVTRFVNAQGMPGLRMKAQAIQGLQDKIAQGDPAAQQQLQELLQGPPPEETEAVPLDLNAPGVSAGQATRRVAGKVADVTGEVLMNSPPVKVLDAQRRATGAAVDVGAGFFKGLAADTDQ